MVGLFVVAAGVMVLAVPPSLVLGGRRRDPDPEAEAGRTTTSGAPATP
jgi:hypothetical protein